MSGITWLHYGSDELSIVTICAGKRPNLGEGEENMIPVTVLTAVSSILSMFVMWHEQFNGSKKTSVSMVATPTSYFYVANQQVVI
jgi:hypothetical protein